MKRLSRLLLIAVLLLAAGVFPGRSNAASTSIDNPIPVREPIASTCGYSAGGEENAYDDALANANRYCINMGCLSATVTTTYDPWVDKDGYTHVCVSFYCNCVIIIGPLAE
ncbi:MAG TPA: hypothetical protein VGM86_28920 [Thermoanaerobaculia bacterium]|jgi:hypothetical protein